MLKVSPRSKKTSHIDQCQCCQERHRIKHTLAGEEHSWACLWFSGKGENYWAQEPTLTNGELVSFPWTSCWVLNISQPPTCILTLDMYIKPCRKLGWKGTFWGFAVTILMLVTSSPWPVSLSLYSEIVLWGPSDFFELSQCQKFDCETTYVLFLCTPATESSKDAGKVFPTLVALLKNSSWNWEGKTARFTMW